VGISGIDAMKIDFVVHSSDSNPYYLDFWPLVSRVWKEVFGLEPVLLYIDDNHSIPIDETYGRVIKFKPVEGVPKYLQCLWIRYWWPSQMPDNVSMISDIDMFPLSKHYFIGQISGIPNDKYVHLNPFHANIPSCYHIALGTLFKDVLGLHDSWEDSVKHLHSLDIGTTHSTIAQQNMTQWGADEKHATDNIRAYHTPSVFVFLKRTLGRLDRSDWRYNPQAIKNGVYADSHSIRPYSDPGNRTQIDKLIGEIYDVCR